MVAPPNKSSLESHLNIILNAGIVAVVSNAFHKLIAEIADGNLGGSRLWIVSHERHTRAYGLLNPNPCQDYAAQEAAARAKHKITMKEAMKGGRAPWLIWANEDPAPPDDSVSWAYVLVWPTVIACCLVDGFLIGWWVRDHLAPWLRLGISYVVHGVRTWLSVHA